MTFCCRTAEFCRVFLSSRISLICLICFSLPDLYFYTISFIPFTMFLKDLNKVNFRVLTETWIIIELLPQNSWSYLVWKEDYFCSLVVEILPCSGCFITCMGAHFPALELDNAIRFSTRPRMSEFLPNSSKWARWFGRFLQYTSGLEVLTCSIDTNLNYVTTML